MAVDSRPTPVADKRAPRASLPVPAPKGLDQYGSNLAPGVLPAPPAPPADSGRGISASCDTPMLSPTSASMGGRATSVVTEGPAVSTPVPSPGKPYHLPEALRGEVGWGSPSSFDKTKSSAGRAGKKKAVRKVPPRDSTDLEQEVTASSPRPVVMALASPVATGGAGSPRVSPPLAALRRANASAAPAAKAARSKAVVSGPVRSSQRPKGAKGGLTALQRAELLTAEKNNELEGNLMPRFAILDAYSDDHMLGVLSDCGIDPSSAGSSEELLSLVRAKERAQAALALAAASRAEAKAAEIEVGASVDALPMEGGEAVVAASTPTPSPRRKVTTRRVAKAVMSRGVRLRNRII